MKNLFKWFLMLNKRLYKKISFVVILLLIPLCVFLFSIAAGQDSGFLHITLAQTDAKDPVSSQIINDLLNEDTIIRFSKTESPLAATEAVKTGQADEAWIFPADTEGNLLDFATSGKDKFISIVCREQTVFTRLSHEKLSCALYEYCAKAYYIDFTRTNIPELDSLSDKELLEYYENVSIDEELFVFGNPTTTEGKGENANYLTVPIRGLLGVIATICGMAAAMYFMHDDASGTFSHVPQTSKIYIAFACLMIAVINISLSMFISLTAAGLSAGILKEIAVLLLYSLCCAVFCLLLKLIIPNIKLYGALCPLLTVIMLVVCPIFFDLKSLSFVQMLFPPTYYVNASYNSSYFLYMGVYALAGGLLCMVLHRLRNLKIRRHK